MAGKGGAELGHALRGRRAPQKSTERAEEEGPAETSGNIMEVRRRKNRLENKMNSVKLKQEDGGYRTTGCKSEVTQIKETDCKSFSSMYLLLD